MTVWESLTEAEKTALYDEEHRIEMESIDYGVARYYELRTQTENAMLKPVQRLMSGAMSSVIAGIERHQETARRGEAAVGIQKWGPLILCLPADKLALISLATMFNLCDMGASMAHVTTNIAQRVKIERTYSIIKKTHPDVVRQVMRNHKNLTPRVVQALKHKLRYVDDQWPLAHRAWIGYKLLETCIEYTTWFRIEVIYDRGRTINTLRLAPDVRDLICQADRESDFLDPLYLPMVVPPTPWTDPETGGYRYHKRFLVKNAERHVKEYREKLGPKVYRAVNVIQNAELRIRKPIFALLKRTWQEGGTLGGLPNRHDLPLPAKPVNFETCGEAKLAWKAEARKVHGENARIISKRKALIDKLWIAEKFLNHKAIWFPVDLDWRGRCYAMPSVLHPQGDDVAKALLEFASGKPLGPRGFWWLSIHVANCFGVDKVSFQERYDWVNRIHPKDLEECVRNPLDNTFWTTADSPWQALAALFEWHEARSMADPSQYVSHMPVGIDGSCNGLQHYSAIGLDPIGARAVNLEPAERPADIYSDVLRLTIPKVEQDAKDGHPLAQNWLGHIFRDTVKRAVMTVPYGVTLQGIRDQFITDGHTKNLEGSQSLNANYLRDVVYDAVGNVVVAARQLMDWLRVSAVQVARKGKAIRWTTPIGFYVIQEYLETRSRIIRTTMFSIYLREPKKDQTVSAERQERGIPPNFVHSHDGSHMGLTALRCHDEYGMTDMIFVHDNYVTHACNVDHMGVAAREEFVIQHTPNQLEIFKQEVEANTGEVLPDLPPRGNFDINKVKVSPYFFH